MLHNVPNDNFFQKTKFKWECYRTPQLTWAVQGLSLPGISINELSQPTIFANIPLPGDKATYDNNHIALKFLVKEDLANWLEIWRWIRGLGRMESFDDFNNLADEENIEPTNGAEYPGEMTNANLFILSNSMNPYLSIEFSGLFPISLSSIDLDSTPTDVPSLTSTVTFAFATMNFSITKPVSTDHP